MPRPYGKLESLMSYIDAILMDDEKIVYQTKPHWIIYSNAAVWIVVSLLLYGFGQRFSLTMYMFGYPLYKLASFYFPDSRVVFCFYFLYLFLYCRICDNKSPCHYENGIYSA